MTVHCRLLGARILCSRRCPCTSGQEVPVYLQGCYFLICNFLSLLNGKVFLLPVTVKPGRKSSWKRAIRYISGYRQHSFTNVQSQKELLGIFQAIDNILLQMCRASMTKYRKHSTRVRAKGLDSVWSQVCSSLSQYHKIWLGNLFSRRLLPKPWNWDSLALHPNDGFKDRGISNSKLKIILIWLCQVLVAAHGI